MTNSETIKKDIVKMIELTTTIYKIERERDVAVRQSEHEGDLFKFRHDSGKYNQWYLDNFPRFKEREGDERIWGYYFLSNSDNKEERDKVYKKGQEIRSAITKPHDKQLMPLREKLRKLKSKYDKYFTDVLCDLPYDGRSDMIDFLKVAVLIMEDK